jgi:DNA polymerase I-like protein with 3'-5' exonuclease and polymerase domains
MALVAIDFEYIEETDRTNQLTISCSMTLHSNGITVSTFYNLIKGDTERFLKDFRKHKNEVFIGYNLIAEITSLLRLGVTEEELRAMTWVDLWTESKMYMLTHPDYYSGVTSLKDGAIKVFNLQYKYDMSKDPIEVILAGKGNYTDEQWQQIAMYNVADTEVLIPLYKKINELHKKYNVTYNEVKFRSDFVLESAIQYVKSNGFPMDVELVKKVFNNREYIKYLVGIECNKETGFEIYRAKVKKRPQELSFSVDAFEKFLIANNMIDGWDKTGKSDKISTKDDVFKKFMQVDETIAQFEGTKIDSIYYARNTIKQLNSTDLSTLLTKNGYIRTPPFPFNQKSGRSSPKPKLGFVLNLVPWIRNTILPKPGKAFISADFSQQEVALAGFLSNDTKLLESYDIDHYITNAIALGFAPKGATKKSHPKERDMMKPLSLGILYGMGLKSMAFRVENHMGWTSDKDKVDVDFWTVEDGEFSKTVKQVSRRAFDIADKFITGHKRYYKQYWEYVETHYNVSMRKGYYKAPVNGWMYFTEEEHQMTQLQNIPNQAGGAAVMQAGYIEASKAGLSIVCSLHDALYVECDIDKVEETKKKLLQSMAEGVKLFSNGALTIRNEVKVYTNEEPYNDPRGVDMLKKIKELIK